MQLLCSILLLPFFGTIWALETSENIQLIQGDGGEIYCKGEEDLDFCEWIGPSGEECMIKKGDEQVECGFGVTKIQEGSCFLTFDKGPIPEDAGEYQCKLIGETIVPGESLLKKYFCKKRKNKLYLSTVCSKFCQL